MTITIDLEELRKHENAVGHWHLNHAMILIKYLRENMKDISGAKVAFEHAMKQQENWVKSNPHPKLIPNV